GDVLHGETILGGGTSFGSVQLKAGSGFSGHDHNSIGKDPGPGLVGIKSVIPCSPYQRIGHVDRSPEPFDTIVLVGNDLNVLDNGPVTDTTKGKSVDLVILSDGHPTVSDGDICNDTGIVSDISATVLAIGFIRGNSLNMGGPKISFDGDGRFSKYDHPAPKSCGSSGQVGPLGLSLCDIVQDGGENDGLLSRSLCPQFTPLVNDQGRGKGFLSFGTFDDGSGFNGKGHAVSDDHFAIKNVDVLG